MLTKIAIVCEKSIFIVDNAQHLVRNIDCMNTVGPQYNLVKKIFVCYNNISHVNAMILCDIFFICFDLRK